MVVHHPGEKLLTESLWIVGGQAEGLVVCPHQSTENCIDVETGVNLAEAIAEKGCAMGGALFFQCGYPDIMKLVETVLFSNAIVVFSSKPLNSSSLTARVGGSQQFW